MTMSAIFAGHAPLIRDYPSAPPTPPAPPAPQSSVSPPQDQPIAFSATTRDVFALIGVSLGSTTLATITCADASMTITQSEVVGGLTFSYSAGVLSVSGTPTGSTRVQRIVISYISSDGNRTVRGSTTHVVTLAKTTEVLTIGSMAGASGRVGVPMSATLASPTSNFAADVGLRILYQPPGLVASLAWTKGVSSGSGTLTLSGTPTQAGTYTVTVEYPLNGYSLGLSSHQVVVSPSYEAPAPTPAPAPAPSPVTPTVPPAPSPAPAFGPGPDPLLSSVKVLIGFDIITGVSYDPADGAPGANVNERGAYGVMRNVETTTDGGAMNYGIVTRNNRARYSSQAMLLKQGALMTIAVGESASTSQISGVDGSDGALAVECFARLGQSAWNALTATGNDGRLAPFVTLVDSAGSVVWMLGFASWLESAAGNAKRVIAPVHLIGQAGAGATALVAAGPQLTSFPDRWVHLAAARKVSGANTIAAVWHDGQAGAAGLTMPISSLRTGTSGQVRIGIAGSAVATNVGTLTPLSGIESQCDELRITAAARYSDYVASTPLDFPTWGTRLPSWANQSIPWPNY